MRMTGARVGVLMATLVVLACGAVARAQAATYTLAPIADAYVVSDAAKTNFGSAAELRAGSSPESRSYLRFDATSVSGKIRSATLRVYASGSSASGYEARAAIPANKSFSEKSITFHNSPNVADTIAAASGPIPAGWTSVDVTSLAAAGSLTIVLTSSSLVPLSFGSREAAGTAPQLEIVTDTTAPAVTLSEPPGGTSSSNATPTFAGVAGTDLGDSATVTVKVYSGDSATGTPVQTLTTTRAADGQFSVAASSVLADGTYTGRAEQSDDAGNTGLSAASTFTIDTTRPAVTLAAPANGSSIGDTTPTFSGSAGTAGGDGSTVTVRVYSGSSATGSPVQTLTTTRQGGSYSVDASSPLAFGTHTARAEQIDAAGNVGTSSANTFTVVDAPPAITLAAPASGSSTNDTMPIFSGTAGTEPDDSPLVTILVYRGPTPSGTPVQTLTTTAQPGGSYAVEASAPLADGAYTAQAEQSDAGGNTGRSSPRTFTVDTTSPAVTLAAPANGSSIGDTTPTFSGSAGTAGGDGSTVTVRVYSGSSATGSPVQTLTTTRQGSSYSVDASAALAAGTYTARAEQTDAAANVGTSTANTFAVVDETPPAITLTAPANGGSTNDTTPTFSGSAGTDPGDSSLVTVLVYSGPSATGTPLQTLTATVQQGGSYSVDAAAPLVQGTYTARAQQSDDAGNTGSSSANTFTVDTAPPDTSITSGPPDPSNSASATFSFSSTETGSTFQCALDGGGFASCSSPKTYSGLTDGSHTLAVRAVDRAGNPDPTPATATWTVDTVAPAVTLATPANGSSTPDTTPAFSGTAGTAAGDAAVVTVNVYSGSAATGTPVQTRTTTHSGGSWSVEATNPLAEGTYTARAEQSDAAGNVGRSSANTFTVGSSSSSILFVDRSSPACSDTGSGTGAQPFCTIGAAASRVTAGKTVQVAAGTYPEAVTVSTSGTSTAPIVFTAAPGATVTVSGQANGFLIVGRGWITITGFSVTNTVDHGIEVSDSSRITLSNNHVTYSGKPRSGETSNGIRLTNTADSLVTGNTVDHNTDAGILLTSGTTRVQVSGNHTFENARVYERAAAGIRLYSAAGNTVAGNVTHDNEDSGIESYTGSNNTLVYNNVAYDNGDHGIDNYRTTGQRLISNTVYRNVTAGINVEGTSTGATIANNISVDNGIQSPRTKSNIRVDSASVSGTTMNYDLVYLTVPGEVLLVWNSTSYTSLASFKSATGRETNGIEADPKWRNPGAGDFHLTAGSPAIDSANSGVSGQPTTDVEGNPRVDDPATPNAGVGPRSYDDRGAYEYRPT